METTLETGGATFEFINRLNDKKRFLLKTVDMNYFVFDRYINSLFEIPEVLHNLMNAGTPARFNQLKESIDRDELKDTVDFLSGLFKIENSEPDRNYHSKTGVCVLKLNFSSQCNLSCTYCFREKEKPATLDDPVLLTKAIDYMVNDCGREAASYTICFNLTGEPMLHEELLADVFKYTKKIKRKTGKKTEIFFVTNGTIIKAKSVKLLKKIWQDRPMAVSLDGPPEIHDSLRHYEGGKGSYARIMENVAMLRKKGMRTTAEAVLTAKHPFPLKIALHFIEEGFAWINMKPVRQGNSCSFNMDNIDKLKTGYDEYFKYLTGELLDENYYPLKVLSKDYALKPLWRILFNSKMDTRCGWGINALSMDHKGDFYPCDSAMGFDQCKTGDVHQGIDWKKFHRNLSVEQRGTCAGCFMKNICSGTCYINGLYKGEDLMAIDPVECSLTSYLIDANLTMICRLMSGGADMDMIKQIIYVNLASIYRLF